MKSNHIKIALILILSLFCFAQGKDRKPAVRSSAPKIFAITDRAAGVHNTSNIGLFFENRGKLYPRRLSDGPSGEYPINSGRHYIWRINPKIGVGADPSQGLPVNVIQCHFTQNEEFEAVGGFHNPDNARVAFSDDPTTWPDSGWPVQDSGENPIVLSDQDSYCVYDDSENSAMELGIEVIQRGYAYGISFAKDLLFFQFDVINKGPYDLDSVYFSLYADIDIGYVSGNSEWEDDMIDIDNDLNSVFLYDYDNYSAEWGGATGYFGIAFLKTPEINGVEAGLTDMHWNDYDDDYDNDSLMFAIMSSNRSYLPRQFEEETYFHENGDDNDESFDDPGMIPDGGDDIVAWGSSGPYNLAQGDTLTFHTAIIAGIDRDSYMTNLASAFNVVSKDYNLPKPPSTPKLSIIPGDGKNILLWDDKAEIGVDSFTEEMDFEGYRIYRSIDKGVHWDNIDRNINTTTGPDPVPMAEFDIINGIGNDTGIEYTYVDNNVDNGFEYWYSLTAFDRGGELIEELESPIGNSLNASNTGSAIPRSNALGMFPASMDIIEYTGSSKTNYTVEFEDSYDASLSGNEYQMDFEYLVRNEIGNLKTESTLIIADSSITKPHKYGIEFVSGGSRVQFLNFTTGVTQPDRDFPYRTGVDYRIDGSNLKISFNDPDTNALPEEGDLITINFAGNIVRNGTDTVMTPRPVSLSQSLASDDGLLFGFKPVYIADIHYSLEESLDLSLVADSVQDLLDTTVILQFSEVQTDIYGEQYMVLNGYFDAIDSLVLIYANDTLYYMEDFHVAGLSGTLGFDSFNPSTTQQTVHVRTYSESPPSLKSSYRFKMGAISNAEPAIRHGFNRDTIKVVPNPYKIASLWEPEFGELAYEPIRQLQFINLPGKCEIFIFTIAGDMIKRLDHNNGTGTAAWDLRTDGGREIAPGIYLYVVKSDDNEYFNRFAVIK